MTLNHIANKLKHIDPHARIKWPIENMKLLHKNKYITDQQWPTNRLLQIKPQALTHKALAATQICHILISCLSDNSGVF